MYETPFEAVILNVRQNNVLWKTNCNFQIVKMYAKIFGFELVRSQVTCITNSSTAVCSIYCCLCCTDIMKSVRTKLENFFKNLLPIVI